MAVITLTNSQIQSGLQSGYSLGATQFTFSIPGAGSTWETGAGDYSGSNQQPFTDYSTLNATEANNFRLALTAWDNLITPDFNEVPDNAGGHGEVRVAFTSDGMSGGTAGYAFQGDNQTPTSLVGDVWINSTSVGDPFDVGTQDYTTFLHELGHVLGLKHPFETPTLPAYDDTRYTVMSYTVPYVVLISLKAGGGYNINWTTVNAITPQVLDIAAVQQTYGANTAYNNGNNTYTFTQGDITTQSIYDGGGTDTIDLGNFTRNNILDLRAGSYSSVGYWTKAEQVAYYVGLTGDTEAHISNYYTVGPTPNQYYEWADNLGIAFNTVIENAVGGSANDTITGNDAANILYLQKGGNDTVTGGAGDDGFYFGAAMTGADSVDGGTGTGDQVGLQGNYAGLTLAAGSLVNVEQLVLLPGNDTRFGDLAGNTYSYNVTTVDANVAAGQQLVVNANTLRSTENVTFNGAAETNGSFLTYGGLGHDAITGSQQNDGFYFGVARWGSSDSVNGQGGTTDQLGLQGNYTAAGSGAITFGASQLAGVEVIVCITGGDLRFGAPAGSGYSYDLTMNDGNVAAGQTLYISANSLLAAGGALASDETLTFHGNAETNGRFVIYCGAGADNITGGAGADEIFGEGGADQLRGGLGNDTFSYIALADSTSGAADQLLDYTSGDHIDLSAIDAISGGADNSFSFIGAAAFSNTAGQLRAYQQTGIWHVEADVNGDGTADLAILVTSDHALAFGDFVL